MVKTAIKGSGKKDITEIVIYTNGLKIDLSSVVQKIEPLSSIKPQHRVPVEGGIYVASCKKLMLDSSGFQGVLKLEYYEEINKDDEPSKQIAFGNQVLNMLFSREAKPVEVEPYLEYEDKKYRKVWRISSGRKSWLILHNEVYKDIIKEIKSSLVNERELVIANDLLNTLFKPIFDVLFQMYRKLSKF